MIYQVVLAKRAKRSLSQLNKGTRVRVILAMDELARSPHYGKKLAGRYAGSWSLRVWPYRIIYQIYKRELMVLVIDVGHRQNVYK